MKYFYKIIRPLVNRTEIQNRTFVMNAALTEHAINLEKEKYSMNRIMEFYYNSIDKLFSLAISNGNINNVFDVGCATGDVVHKIAKERKDIKFIAIDIMDEAINEAQKNNTLSNLSFKLLDFIHDEIKYTPDLITCFQTLEHIEDKYLQYFFDKMFTHSKQAVIFSVPREPFWCIANIIRFKYWTRLGNTPHHIQHWSRNNFINIVSKTAKNIWGNNIEIYVESPLMLWSIILVKNLKK